MNKSFFNLILVTALLIIGCGKSINENDFPGISTSNKITELPSGLKYIDMIEGEGVSPESGKVLSVHYTGYLLTGEKFDSSVDRNEPFEFTIGLGQVIKGWDEGVLTMKVGGKRKLIIPPQIGYGSRQIGDIIPANSTLVFDVELLKVFD